jgi:hypothetical protein
MYGFATPAVLAVINILMWLFIIGKDSMFFLIDNGNEKDALF